MRSIITITLMVSTSKNNWPSTHSDKFEPLNLLCMGSFTDDQDIVKSTLIGQCLTLMRVDQSLQ